MAAGVRVKEAACVGLSALEQLAIGRSTGRTHTPHKNAGGSDGSLCVRRPTDDPASATEP